VKSIIKNTNFWPDEKKTSLEGEKSKVLFDHKIKSKFFILTFKKEFISLI